MHISLLAEKLLAALKSDGLTTPKACFQNCFVTVTKFNNSVPGGMYYVLCWLIDTFDVKHPHAIIRIGDQYFDQTVQANPAAYGYVSGYEVVEQYSRGEAINLFKDAGGRIEVVDGALEIEGIPPALFSDGSVRCEVITST